MILSDFDKLNLLELNLYLSSLELVTIWLLAQMAVMIYVDSLPSQQTYWIYERNHTGKTCPCQNLDKRGS